MRPVLFLCLFGAPVAGWAADADRFDNSGSLAHGDGSLQADDAKIIAAGRRHPNLAAGPAVGVHAAQRAHHDPGERRQRHCFEAAHQKRQDADEDGDAEQNEENNRHQPNVPTSKRPLESAMARLRPDEFQSVEISPLADTAIMPP